MRDSILAIILPCMIGIAVGSFVAIKANHHIILDKSVWECSMRNVQNNECVQYEIKDESME